jgi:hypothetical protein
MATMCRAGVPAKEGRFRRENAAVAASRAPIERLRSSVEQVKLASGRVRGAIGGACGGFGRV